MPVDYRQALEAMQMRQSRPPQTIKQSKGIVDHG
jgi:glutamate synthase (NADPH) large chain